VCKCSHTSDYIVDSGFEKVTDAFDNSDVKSSINFGKLGGLDAQNAGGVILASFMFLAFLLLAIIVRKKDSMSKERHAEVFKKKKDAFLYVVEHLL
jgi:hypothetical protein